jgi:hypothetical protein
MAVLTSKDFRGFSARITNSSRADERVRMPLAVPRSPTEAVAGVPAPGIKCSLAGYVHRSIGSTRDDGSDRSFSQNHSFRSLDEGTGNCPAVGRNPSSGFFKSLTGNIVGDILGCRS